MCWRNGRSVSTAADEALMRRHVDTIAPLTSRRGAALMVEAMPEMVARTAADGAHVPNLGGLSAALKIRKPGRIVGAGGLKTRHDAMVAGEMGADYVMFGEPDATVPLVGQHDIGKRPTDIDPDPPRRREDLTSRRRIMLALAAEIDQQRPNAWI